MNKDFSVYYREQGNYYFKQSRSELNKECEVRILGEAARLYELAINHAKDSDEMSSAYKNHSVASFDLFKATKLEIYIVDCFKSLNKAIESGRAQKPIAWLKAINEKASICFQEYLTQLKENESKDSSPKKDISKTFASLVTLIKHTPDHIKCEANYQLALNYYYESIKRVNEKEIISSIGLINHASYYFNESRRLFNLIKSSSVARAELPAEFFNVLRLDELQTNIEEQFKLVDAHKCKFEGDTYKGRSYGCYLDSSEEVEELEHLAWTAIDLYRCAIVKAKNHSLLLEAEILSEIGFIYDQLLNQQAIAKKTYYECFNLFQTTYLAQSVLKSAWYLRCLNVILSYQKEVVNKEEIEREKEKNKVLDKIQKDLDDIKNFAQTKSNFAYLKFLHKKYPPKFRDKSNKILKDGINESSVTTADLKKAYQSALISYHPDKNSEAKYGKPWRFIAEQISKELGSIYGKFKNITE